ncbi:MAG: C40 family peptidase [Clostridia bacterium]|nr:C40 family peptidase [Clostridia bacterium]MBR4955298.1 C40 family peptidase [Clostridia bacterium]
MKKLTALILALAMLTAVFAGCGDTDTQADQPDNSQTGTTTPDDTNKDQGEQSGTADSGNTDTGTTTPDSGSTSTDTPATREDPDPTTLREFDTPEQEALVVVAEAYYARKVYLQYEDTRMVQGNVTQPTYYRWQKHENSPESLSSQYTGYTNCAAFCYDVYKEAFDLDIVHWYTAALNTATDMHVFYHTIRGNETEEEKKQIEQQFRDTVQPGDILNCIHKGQDSGHAMLYVGDGKILHSSGTVYNYDTNKDVIEARGTVQYLELNEIFSTEGKCYFWGETAFAIVRPLIKYTDAQITEETKIRVEKMQNVYIEKLSSHTMGQTVDLGEEITYTFMVRNGRTHTIDIEISDIIPQYTTYVSGADKVEGDKISWQVKIPSGETKKISFTVKVDNNPELYNGGYIYSADAKVGGIGVTCRPVFVGKHLSQDDQAKITAACDTLGITTLKGIALAQEIYAKAGVQIDELPHESDLIASLFKPYGTTMNHKEYNTQSEYFGMVAPTMYGGYYVVRSDAYNKERTRGIYGSQISAGDILVCKEINKFQCYLYAGKNKVVDLTTGKLLDLGKTQEALLSTIGYDQFVVIRPAMK